MIGERPQRVPRHFSCVDVRTVWDFDVNSLLKNLQLKKWSVARVQYVCLVTG